MNRHIVIVGALALGALCFGAIEDELQPAMKTLAATNGKARKDMEAKSNSDLAADAKILQENLAKVAAVFEKQHMMDVAKLARNGEAAAKDLASAAEAGNAEKIDAAMKAVGASCGGCHMAHREKVGETYKFKQ
jgi:cytochrome c556